MNAAATHRKDDNNGDHRSERAIDASSIDGKTLWHVRMWQIGTIVSVAFSAGVILTTYKLTRDADQKIQQQRYEDIMAKLAAVSTAPDRWTGTNMYTYAAITKEWNPELIVPNPLDIQANRRVTKLKLPEVGMLP